MQKLVLLLIALTIAPWAKTWEDGETFSYFAWFEDDSLDRPFGYDWPTEETMRGLYLVQYGERRNHYGLDDVYSLSIQNYADDFTDSIWVSKYWMDDSLRESPVVMDADVDRDDFRLLTFDSLHTEYEVSTLMDERAENTSLRSSLFLLYRKDSSYYALCLLGDYPSSCEFYLSCQFQDDGTTNFKKIPNTESIEFSVGCATSLPKASRRGYLGLQKAVLYRVDGSRSRGGASSVIIRDGQPKLELRK